MELEPCILLAQQIMDVIRASGMTKVQGHSALSIAGTLLMAAEDINPMSFSPELLESPVEQS